MEAVLLPAPAVGGALLLLVNWQMAPSEGLTVSFPPSVAPAFKTATLASTGATLHVRRGEAVVVSVGKLEYADAVMLR